MTELSHLDAEGRAHMVNVGRKPVTRRVCVAAGEVEMNVETVRRIAEGDTPKGDVLATARIAGIQAAKRTAEWIPLAHPLPLDAVHIDLRPEEVGGAGFVRIEARVEAEARTGVEMEALVAVSAAGLTIYDMCKAVDRRMSLSAVRLISKTGGKSGTFTREAGAELDSAGPER